MKKITLLVVLIAFFFGFNQTQAQVQPQALLVINEPANWPNSDWEVTIFDPINFAGFVHNPSDNPFTTPTPGSSFGFDNVAEDTPNGHNSFIFDNVIVSSPMYDLRAATQSTPAEEQVVVSFNYVYYQVGTSLKLQWSVGGNFWNDWQDISGNSTSSTDYANCNGQISFTSQPLLISTLSEGELQSFRYRIAYSDNQANFQFGGFCIDSPTLTSQETAQCIAVSGISADTALIFDDHATIAWSDNNGVTPQDGWEIEYGPTNFTQGSGTTVTTFNNPYVLNGLNASTCYDVYVRALCDSANSVASDWSGPYNFCTPIAVAGCGDMFYDIGGPNGQYTNSQNETTTICPDNAGDVLTVIFDSFETENCCDYLQIYDGSSTSSPLIGEYRGTNSPGMISADIANGGCLTFVFHSDSSVTRDGWEARILCSPPITCFIPENLAVNESSITIHTAEVSWNDTNTTPPQSGWEIEYGPMGFAQGTGTLVTATTNPFTLTNLDPATEYCYYVKAVCGANSGDEDSFWQGPVCFTTKCDVFQAPYSENFESGGVTPTCWTQGANNSEDWLFDNDVTNPGHIGNAGNMSGTTTLSGGYFAYVDDSNPNSTNTYLLSPFVDLTGIADPTLAFYYASNDEFFNKFVNFSVDIWDGTTWHEDVFTHNQSNGDTNGWEQVFVDLNAYANQTIQVRFDVDENNNGTRDDLAIDDVFIGEMPTCVNVNGIVVNAVGATDVNLTWSDGNNPSAGAWQVVYGAPGFDPDTATTNDTTNNVNYVQGGLTDQTDYELYIRADCGNGDYSLWAGPITFTTLCPIFDAPYHEDFSDGGMLDACWEQSQGVDVWAFSNTIGTGNTAHVGNAGDVMGTVTESGGYFAYVDDSTPSGLNNSITTPLINTATLTSPTLYFYYVSNNEGNTNVAFSVDVWDGAAWNTNFFTSSSNTEGWEQVALDLTNLTITGPIQIKFTVDESNGSDFYDDLAIDDVKVDEAPDCWPIFDPITSNPTTTTIDIAWTDTDNDPGTTTYTIEYGPVGFTFGSGTQQDVLDTDGDNLLDNPYTITGLDVDTDWDFYIIAHCPNGDSILGPVQGTTLPTCLQVTGINIVTNTTTSVSVSWTDINTPTPLGGWTVEVVYPTFDQGTGTEYNVTTLPTATTPFVIDNLIPSSTFEIYVSANCEADGSDPSRWRGPFTITTQVGPPLNDFCADAIELNVTADCEPKLGNNIQATQTAPALATNCSDPAIDGTTAGFTVDDVWYKFTMPASGNTLIQTGFAGVMEDSAIAVYRVDDANNECGSLVPAVSYFPNGNINYAYSSCSDDDDFIDNDANDNNRFSMVQLVNQTPGDVFYVRVWSVDRSNLTDTGGQNLHGQFTICITNENVFNRGALGVEDEVSLDETILNYYPNPTNFVLNLKANTSIKATSIYSMLGQEVQKQKFSNSNTEVVLDMSTLPSGTYFVKVLLANDTTKTIKIIRN